MTPYAGLRAGPRRPVPAPVAVARALVADTRDVLTATDPGLLRLRLGLRAGIGVLLVVGVQALVAPAVGLPTIVAMLFGGMIAMNGSFASSSRRPLDAAGTLAGFPLAALVGIVPATLLHPYPVAALVGFVVVMVAAVFVRRFGPRWFNYGMVAWLAYFFTIFVGFRPEQIGALVAVVASAAACIAVTAALLVPDRPDRLLVAAVRAYDLRLEALLAAGAAALDGSLPPDRAPRVLHGRTVRVIEAALIVDGYLAGAVTDDRIAAARRHDLLETELAAEELASAAAVVAAATDVPAQARTALLGALEAAQRSDPDAVRAAADRVRETADAARAGTSCGSVTARRLVDAADALGRLAHARKGGHDHLPQHITRYEPAVPLFLGNLPGSAASASGALSLRPSWWSRRSLNTRLCVQVALAASVTVVAGHALSPQRYYWAVLACFLAMTGTFTTGETLVKGASRVIGTVLGLLAATAAVHFTGQSHRAVVVVMVLCVVLGLYLFRVSYVFMAFAVTTVMGELYNVLREFSESLLLLRLEETALGAGIAILVALVVLPVRTTDAQAAAEAAVVDRLGQLLDDVAERLAFSARVSNLFLDARRVDAALHQLALVARPAGGATLLGVSGRRAERDLSRWTAAAYRARALAVAATELEPAAHPELAVRCEVLRDRLRGESSVDRPVVPAAAVEGDNPRALRRFVALLTDLEEVVSPLLDEGQLTRSG